MAAIVEPQSSLRTPRDLCELSVRGGEYSGNT